MDETTTTPLRVLLVEDSMLAAERIGDSLASVAVPMQIKLAQTQDGAIAVAEGFKPELVVLDLQLREGTGFGVLKALSNKDDKRPLFIVMTNYALPNYRSFAKLTGADHFLDKSIDLPRLKTIIEEFVKAKDEDSGVTRQ